MIILGIDPGFRFAGFCIIKKEKQRSIMLASGYLEMKYKESIKERVRIFYDFMMGKISEFDITHLALETPFFGKNAQNFLKLGYLRGILYLLASQNKIEIIEFSPREVKLTLTGFGGASKDQVAIMIKKIFPNFKDTSKNDVTDAIAITLCGLWNKEKTYNY